LHRSWEKSVKVANDFMKNKRLPRWIAVGVTFAVALAATSSILGLRRWADNASQSTLQLTQLQLLVSRLDGLEWRAIAAKKLSPELKKEFEATELQANTFFQKSSQEYLKQHMELYKAYQDYIDAIHQEFILLDQGNIDRAMIVDEERVDPSYERLEKSLHEHNQESELITHQANQQADIGTILSILTAAMAIGFTLQKIGRANRATEIAIAEQKILQEKLRSN
jgi:hypothetical protein